MVHAADDATQAVTPAPASTPARTPAPTEASTPAPTPAPTEASAPAPVPARDGPSGIGGWLILPIIGLILTVALTAVNLVVTVPTFTPEVLANLYETRPGLLLFAVLSLAMGLGILVFALRCLSLIFHKSPKVPATMQVFYATMIAVAVVELVGMMGHPRIYSDVEQGQAIRDVVRSAIGAAIWIPYFRVSKRVRNTFVDADAERRRMGEVFE